MNTGCASQPNASPISAASSRLTLRPANIVIGQVMAEKSRRALSRPILRASLRDSRDESNQAAASSIVS